MKLLALETSAKAVSAAILDGDTVLASCYQNSGLTHSRTLMPMVDAMLANAELAKQDLDCIAIAQGPGSFTGIRIGVSSAKGLSFALDKPLVGVSTLEAMAYSMCHSNTTLVCAMDARRSQVYNANFIAKDGALTRLCPDRAIALVDLAAELQAIEGSITVIGDGAKLCHDFLAQQGIQATLAPPHLVMQSAIGVGYAAQMALAQGVDTDGATLTPAYLRLSQAERERNQRLQKEASQ